MTDLCPNCGSPVTFAHPTNDRAAAFNDENPAWSCNSCGRSGDTLELEAAEREAAATAMSTDDLLDQLDNAGCMFCGIHRFRDNGPADAIADAHRWGAHSFHPGAADPEAHPSLTGYGPTRHAALAALVAQLDQVKA